MFGLSKKERFAKETARTLHEQYFMSPQNAQNLVGNHVHIIFPAISTPDEGAIILASVAYKIFLDHGRIAEAERILARVWYIGSHLVSNGVISKPGFEKIVEDLPPRETESASKSLTTNPLPSRVDCARAGWIFTFYWQIYLPKKLRLPEASAAEQASIEGPLRAVFVNPRFGVEKVSAAYQAGKGSNDVLQAAMSGLPDYAFRWFRIGQVVNGLLDATTSAGEPEYALAEVAVRGNLSTGGVSEADCDLLLRVGREIRETYSPSAPPGKVIELVGRLQEDFLKFAAKQDNFSEFEKLAMQHGGVFISYSRSDKEIVENLAKRLESGQIGFWLDDNEIVAGTKVKSSLSSGIENNCVFLIVLSPASLSSPWVKYELDQALGRSEAGTHVVVPILIKGVTEQDIPLSIQDIVCIDFSGGIDQNFGKLLRTINSHLVSFEERRRQTL